MLCDGISPVPVTDLLLWDRMPDDLRGSSGSRLRLQLRSVYISPDLAQLRAQAFFRHELPLSHDSTKGAFPIELFTFKTFLFL